MPPWVSAFKRGPTSLSVSWQHLARRCSSRAVTHIVLVKDGKAADVVPVCDLQTVDSAHRDQHCVLASQCKLLLYLYATDSRYTEQ